MRATDTGAAGGDQRHRVEHAAVSAHNRRYLNTLVRKCDSVPDSEWGCIYMDIDHFKQLKEKNGHSEGDSVLVKMARYLMRHVRAEEACIRAHFGPGLRALVPELEGIDAALLQRHRGGERPEGLGLRRAQRHLLAGDGRQERHHGDG